MMLKLLSAFSLFEEHVVSQDPEKPILLLDDRGDSPKIRRKFDHSHPGRVTIASALIDSDIR